MRRRDFITGIAVAAIAGPPAAHAKAWPAQLVRIVCPLAAGGGIDATARIVAAHLSEIWGQQVVVENKSGASGNIAAEFVARSDPDGYTIYIATFPHATNGYLYPSLGYDPVADFAPVTLIGLYPLMMVVPNSSPAYSVREFIAYARASKLSYASSGHGTSLHLAGELFKRRAGIEMTHVPYRGAGPAFNDLIPGRVDAMINFTASSLPLARQGQLRALAVATAKRLEVAPDLPTMAEAGVTGVEVSSWSAFFVPAKTPQDIIRKIHDDTVAVLAEPAVRGKLEQVGVVVIGSTPDELAAFLSAEMDKWGHVIKAANIRAQ
jgi:tripartite-type tricarboxylate transporter receptor subunit TctC